MELRRWRPGRAFRRPFPSAHPHTRRAQSKQQREPRGEAVARRNRRSGLRALCHAPGRVTLRRAAGAGASSGSGSGSIGSGSGSAIWTPIRPAASLVRVELCRVSRVIESGGDASAKRTRARTTTVKVLQTRLGQICGREAWVVLGEGNVQGGCGRRGGGGSGVGIGARSRAELVGALLRKPFSWMYVFE